MNPSYNSGSGSNAGGQNNIGAPGTKPGVIASGPDPEDAPATPISIPAASKESSRSKISSLLGKRKSSASTGGSVISPMGPQPMQLSGNSGKPKKGLIFGGLAVIVILIVALVIGMNVGKGGKSGNKVVNTSTAFNEMAKYMLFGDANDNKNIADVKVENSEFAVVAQNGDYKKQQSFFEKAKEYIVALKNTTTNTDSELAKDVLNLEDEVVVLENLSLIAYTDILMSPYISDDKTTQTQINDVEINSTDKYKGILELNKNLIADSKKLYQNFSSAGCFKDGELVVDCVNSLVDNNITVTKLQDAVSNSKKALRKYISSLCNSVYSNIKKISEEKQ